MRNLVLIAHNIRSAHNVGSLLRTAEGLGAAKVYLTGYTPHPSYIGDTRLPHISNKQDALIGKTSLGAERMVPWTYEEDIFTVLSRLRAQGYEIYALEQTADSVQLPGFKAGEKCALLLGSEVTGIAPELLAETSISLVIPMYGRKESFNVVQAAAMALYELRFH
ncbi:hypothetical protein BH10PAT3_BH10PAT3_7080 [soil metagenome]